jgi:hypothetical protein
MIMKIRSYSEVFKLNTFEERFQYLKLSGGVGRSTFGFDRYINQAFYTSREWKNIRDFVIVRDDGCDLGVVGYEINTEILIHHINPMNVDAIFTKQDWILDPEYLITTTHRTHNSIHFGKTNLFPKVVINRTPRDTKLW